MIVQLLWLVLGLVAAAGFLRFAKSRGPRQEQAILGQGLVVAAIIYVGFALVWGNGVWLAIEIGGVLLYGLFVLMALRYSMIWLAVGWSAHSLWDILLHLVGYGYGQTYAHAHAPEWYVIACLSFDLLVAGAILLRVNEWKQACGPILAPNLIGAPKYGHNTYRLTKAEDKEDNLHGLMAKIFRI